MISAKTELGRALQMTRMVARMRRATEFLRDNRRNDDADAVEAAIKFVQESEAMRLVQDVSIDEEVEV